MTSSTKQTGRVMGILAISGIMACGAGVASAQPQQSGPAFKTPLVYPAMAVNPYGIASADILDASGQSGQDGYPEIAIVCTGVDLFAESLLCDDVPSFSGIEVFHNLGATVSWNTNPGGALVSHQDDFVIPSGVWVMEVAFADVTGANGDDLVVLGQDPDLGKGYLLIYSNLGNGDFATTPYVRITTDVAVRGLITADLDGDGDIDVAAAGSELDCFHGANDIFVVFENVTTNASDPQFVNHPNQLDIAGDTAPGDIVTGDFYALSPGQSFRDLVTPNPGAASYTKVKNLGNLQFDPTTVSLPAECEPEWDFVTAAADKFGADAWWDFVAVDPDDLFAGVFKGSELGVFGSFCDDTAFGYKLYTPALEDEIVAHGVDTGNLDCSNNPDIVVVILDLDIFSEGPEWPAVVAVLLGKSDGTFITESPTQTFLFSTDPDDGETWVRGSCMVEVVDMDANGIDDIVVTNHFSDNISVLINLMAVSIGPG